MRVPGRAMSVEVSHDDVVITEVQKKVKVRLEIRETTGCRRDVNIVNVDGDIVDSSCNREDVVGRE